MDTPSDYDRSPQGSESSATSDLIKRVEEFQKTDELEKLERLTDENASLQHDIIRYQRVWCAVLDLLQDIQKTIQVLQSALERCARGEAAADRDWFAFWGIRTDGEGPPGPGFWL
jgi:phosphomevalonate kinase